MIKINFLPQIDDIVDFRSNLPFANHALQKNYSIKVMLPSIPQVNNYVILNDYIWQKTYEKWLQLIKYEENPINLLLMDFAERHREIDLSKWKPRDILDYFFFGRKPDKSVNEKIRDRIKAVQSKGEEGSIFFDTRVDEIYVSCTFVNFE